MDAFDRYGKDLVDAGRRRRRRSAQHRRPRLRAAVLAVLVVALGAGVVLTLAVLSGGRGVAAEAAELVARIRGVEASTPACRVVGAAKSAVVVNGVEPLPSTRATIQALRRPQSPAERRYGLAYLTQHRLRVLRGASILADSMRILHGARGASVLVVVTHRRSDGGDAPADPIACLRQQRTVLHSVASGQSFRAQRAELLPGGQAPSRAVVVRAESILLGEMARQRPLVQAGDDEIYAAFREHRQIVGTVTTDVASFVRNGEVIDIVPRGWSSVHPMLVGLALDGALSVELKSTTGHRRITTSVIHNTFAIAVWRTLGHRPALILRGRDGKVLRQVAVNMWAR
ncbi:MAG: hypothetical protein ACRDK2_16960 [Solirubrobacteraceae bacterium]